MTRSNSTLKSINFLIKTRSDLASQSHVLTRLNEHIDDELKSCDENESNSISDTSKSVSSWLTVNCGGGGGGSGGGGGKIISCMTFFTFFLRVLVEKFLGTI